MGLGEQAVQHATAALQLAAECRAHGLLDEKNGDVMLLLARLALVAGSGGIKLGKLGDSERWLLQAETQYHAPGTTKNAVVERQLATQFGHLVV